MKPNKRKLGRPLRRAGKRTLAAVAAVKANADERAVNLSGIVAAIRASGATSLRKLPRS